MTSIKSSRAKVCLVLEKRAKTLARSALEDFFVPVARSRWIRIVHRAPVSGVMQATRPSFKDHEERNKTKRKRVAFEFRCSRVFGFRSLFNVCEQIFGV